MTAVEVDERASNGVKVRLLWDAETDQSRVEVTDDKGEMNYTITARDRAEAIRAFQHPGAFRPFENTEMEVSA